MKKNRTNIQWYLSSRNGLTKTSILGMSSEELYEKLSRLKQFNPMQYSDILKNKSLLLSIAIAIGILSSSSAENIDQDSITKEVDKAVSEKIQIKTPDPVIKQQISQEKQDIKQEMPNNISQENQIRISPQTIKISGHQTRGYFLDHNKINNMKKSTQTTINGIGSDLTGEQKQFFVNLYETIGYAESCYPVGNRVFSIEKQVGVKNGAYGFIQVETYTAIDVISQAIDAQRSNNPKVSMSYKNLDANCRQIFGMNLQGIKSYIQSKPAESLNNDNISMLVLFLKFRNRGFKDIQNFYDTNTMKNYTQNDYVSIWKNVWNTSKGGGTIPGGIQKNNEMRKLINGSK